MTDAFAHHLRLDQVHDGERLELVADEVEREAIARRLGLETLERLEAHVTLSKTGEVIRAQGRLGAQIEQSCVVTGDPIAVHVDEPFDLLFMPEPQLGRSEEEIELGGSDLDVVFHDGAAFDLGAAIADSLALSLEPYPRSAGADAALREAGVMSEAEASPFAALAQLKKGSGQL